MISERIEDARSIATRGVHTYIGGAALAGEFLTSRQQLQSWLKKAERRGSKIAAGNQKRLRAVIGEVRLTSLDALRRGQQAGAEVESEARGAARRARRSTPRVRVSRRARRATTGTGRGRARRVNTTTVSVDTPVSQAG